MWLALSARSCRRGSVHSGGGRRRAALTAPLPAAPRSRSSRWRRRAAALTAAWRSAAAASRSQLSRLAWRVMMRRALSARSAVGAVASTLKVVAVALLLRRRCLRRRARAPCAGVAVPPHSRRRGARPPLLRGGGSRSWLCTVWLAARALCVCRRHSCVVSFGNRQCAALTTPLTAAPRSQSTRRLGRAAPITVT